MLRKRNTTVISTMNRPISWAILTGVMMITSYANVFFSRTVFMSLGRNGQNDDDLNPEPKSTYKHVYIHVATWLLLLLAAYMFAIIVYASSTVATTQTDSNESFTIWNLICMFNTYVTDLIQLSWTTCLAYLVFFVIIYAMTLMFLVDTDQVRWYPDAGDAADADLQDKDDLSKPIAAVLMLGLMPSFPLIFKSQLLAPLLPQSSSTL
jgi:hypothetical protein